jgi:hypothetical protein
MPVPQISAHVSWQTHERFRTYSGLLGLKDSEVAKLLILRELQMQRLKASNGSTVMPLPVRQVSGKAVRLRKITAHMTSIAQVQRFDEHADRCGLSRSSAAALLMRKELDERWLERCLRKKG